MNRQKSRAVTVPYLVLTVLFVVCLIVSNLTEIKTVDLGWFTITAGVVVFPISYIINDCVVEVYGFGRARLMIWLGFAMSLFVAGLLNVAMMLPGSSDWQGAGGYGGHLFECAAHHGGQFHGFHSRVDGQRLRDEPHEGFEPGDIA